MRADDAPYGVPFVSRDCPFAARGNNGEYLLLEDCVQSTDEYGRVTEWVTFFDALQQVGLRSPQTS